MSIDMRRDNGEDRESSGDERRLGELVAGYVERLTTGERIGPEAVLAEHPTLGPLVLEELEGFVFLGAESSSDQRLGTFGDYTLRRQIGRGGMGLVYDAWESSMDRHVALKILPAGLAADSRASARFMREAQAAGKLSHQNIVGVYSTGVREGTPWYSMEYVDGETLAQILKRLKAVKGKEEEKKTILQGVTRLFGKRDSADVPAGPPPASPSEERPLDTDDVTPEYCYKVARAIAGVAEGLQHAHAKGIIHRDIKPSNLILDREGRLRILDFGLARMEGQESLTMSGDFLGTVLYMSPEQAMARRIPIDHRTDIYSLGATMYELLAWRPPFQGKTSQDTLSKIILHDPPPLRKANPRMPKDLETITLKCLRKDASERYGTAEALAQDLNRFVRGDPIEARPETRAAFVTRYLRRRWRSLSVMAVTLVLTAIVIFLLVRQAQQAHLTMSAEYAPLMHEAAMWIQRNQLAVDASSRRAATVSIGKLSTGAAQHLRPEDFTPTENLKEGLERIVERLEEMTRALPERPEAHYFLAYALVLLGNHREARALLEGMPLTVRRFVPTRLLEADLAWRAQEGVEDVTDETVAQLLEDDQGLQPWERSWLRAQGAVRRSEWEQVARAYGELLAAPPGEEEPFVGVSVQAQLGRGIARLELEDYRGAILDFSRTWGRWPAFLEPALLLGKAYCLSGDPDGAEYIFNDLYNRMAGPAAEELATWVVAVYGTLKNSPRLGPWAERIPGSLKDRLRCFPLLWRNRYEEAADGFREALARYPDDPNLLCGLGFSLAYATEGRCGPQHVSQVRELSSVAEKFVSLCSAQEPTDLSLAAHAYYVLVVARIRQNDLEAARTAAEECLAIVGGERLTARCAQASALIACGEFKAAEEGLRALDKHNVFSYTRLGKALEGQHRYDEALVEYRNAIKVLPRSGHAYAHVARVLLAQGRPEEAKDACLEALARFPKNTSGYETLALALRQLGRPEDALKATDVGIERVPDRTGLHVVQAQILAELGQTENAVRSLCRCLELDPDHADAHTALEALLTQIEAPLRLPEITRLIMVLEERSLKPEEGGFSERALSVLRKALKGAGFSEDER